MLYVKLKAAVKAFPKMFAAVQWVVPFPGYNITMQYVYLFLIFFQQVQEVHFKSILPVYVKPFITVCPSQAISSFHSGCIHPAIRSFNLTVPVNGLLECSVK